MCRIVNLQISGYSHPVSVVEAAAPAAVAQLRQPLHRPRQRINAAIGALDVVIVSYRCRDHLRRCLTALEAHAPDTTRVWVVDNDSQDGTVEMIRSDFPAVSVLSNDENLGFARATNIGIAAG